MVYKDIFKISLRNIVSKLIGNILKLYQQKLKLKERNTTVLIKEVGNF